MSRQKNAASLPSARSVTTSVFVVAPGDVGVEAADRLAPDVHLAADRDPRRWRRRRKESAMSSGRPCEQFEVAVDGLALASVLPRRSAWRRRYTTQRGGQILSGGDGQVAHPAAADVGGVGTTDPVTVDQQLRGVDRAAHHNGSARRQFARRRKQFRVLRVAGHRDLDGSAHSGFGDREPVSTRARQPGQDGRRAGQRGVGRRGIALGAVRGNQVGGQLQRLGDRRGSRRGGAVERVGGPNHQLLGVVGAVEPAALAVRVGEMVERDVEQAGGGVQPRRVAGQLIQRQQPGGQRRVVLQDRGAVTDPSAQAGPPQPAVNDMQVDDGARALRSRRRGIRADRVRRLPRRAR